MARSTGYGYLFPYLYSIFQLEYIVTHHMISEQKLCVFTRISSLGTIQ